MTSNRPLCIGILGAARIAPWALCRPACVVPDAVVHAIAARDQARARAFAKRYRIPHVHNSYNALLADPNIDAVYNPLPNSLHAKWTIKALYAGKHVLCEKPIASNAYEAEQIAAAANETGLVVTEAFHNLYHPLAVYMKDVVMGGTLGEVQHIDTRFCTHMARQEDIRLHYALGGGSTMDQGCYCIRLLRYLTGTEPAVVSARAICTTPQVDHTMAADLQFPDDITARMVCSFRASYIPSITLRVVGARGEMHVVNPVLPQLFNWVTVRIARGTMRRFVWGKATYWYQLQAFVQEVHGVRTPLSDARDGVANMRVIDAIYERAGLQVRGDNEQRI